MLANKQKRTKQQQQYKNCFGSATCKELLNTKLSSINCANFTIKFISLMSLKNDDLIVIFLKLSKLLPMSTDFVMNCSFSDSKTCSIFKIKRFTNVRLLQSHHNRHYSNEIIFITNFESLYIDNNPDRSSAHNNNNNKNNKLLLWQPFTNLAK